MSKASEGAKDTGDYVSEAAGDVGEYVAEDIWREPGGGGILPVAVGALAGGVVGGPLMSSITAGQGALIGGGLGALYGDGGDGGSGGDGDEEIRQRIGTVAKRQEEMAKQQWEMYKEFFLPYEIEAAKANRELLPLITEASKTTLGLQVPATKEFYKQAIEGVDVGKRVSEAQTDVISATRLGEGMRRREISRYGIDPSSTTYGDLANQAALATAKNIGGARMAAREKAEAENFARLGYGLGRGVYQTQVGPGADPFARAAGSYSGAASTYAPLVSRVLQDDYNKRGSLLGGLLGAGVGGYYGGAGGATAGYGVGSGIGGML